MIIDMHAHVVPESFPDPGARAGAGRWPSMDHFEPHRAKVMIAGENFRTVSDVCWNQPRRTEEFRREGVDAQVISPMPDLLSYWFTPEDGLDMSRHLNEFIAALVQSDPDHYHGLGTVPLQDPDLAAKELAGLKEMGLAGIEVGSNVNGLSLGDPRFLAFFQEAERQGISVFVHALRPTMADRVGANANLINAVCFPIDTGLTIASLIANHVIERCPSLRLAFSHGGGTFPFGLPRLEHAWSGRWNGERASEGSQGSGGPLRPMLPKSPTEYARTLYYDTLVFDHRAIRYLVDLLGSTQLMIGTDFPFMAREQPVGATLFSLGLEEADLENITWRNCLRFLGQPEG